MIYFVAGPIKKGLERTIPLLKRFRHCEKRDDSAMYIISLKCFLTLDACKPIVGDLKQHNSKKEWILFYWINKYFISLWCKHAQVHDNWASRATWLSAACFKRAKAAETSTSVVCLFSSRASIQLFEKIIHPHMQTGCTWPLCGLPGTICVWQILHLKGKRLADTNSGKWKYFSKISIFYEMVRETLNFVLTYFPLKHCVSHVLFWFYFIFPVQGNTVNVTFAYELVWSTVWCTVAYKLPQSWQSWIKAAKHQFWFLGDISKMCQF